MHKTIGAILLVVGLGLIVYSVNILPFASVGCPAYYQSCYTNTGQGASGFYYYWCPQNGPASSLSNLIGSGVAPGAPGNIYVAPCSYLGNFPTQQQAIQAALNANLYQPVPVSQSSTTTSSSTTAQSTTQGPASSSTSSSVQVTITSSTYLTTYQVSGTYTTATGTNFGTCTGPSCTPLNWTLGLGIILAFSGGVIALFGKRVEHR